MSGFTTMDPLAEKHYSESPYSYCDANPVNRVDPSGMDWYYNSNSGKDPVWFDGNDEVSGYDSHSSTCYRKNDEGNLEIFSPQDNYSQRNANEAKYAMYGFPGGGHSENIAEERIANGNSGSGENTLNADAVNNVKNLANILNSGIGLLENGLNQELKTVTNGSAKAAEIAKGLDDLANSTKYIKIEGKALGITSAIQHGIKVWDALSKDGDIDWKSAGINSGKLALDILFTFGKSTNPVFLGASVAYGVADYLTNEY